MFPSPVFHLFPISGHAVFCSSPPLPRLIFVSFPVLSRFIFSFRFLSTQGWLSSFQLMFFCHFTSCPVLSYFVFPLVSFCVFYRHFLCAAVLCLLSLDCHLVLLVLWYCARTFFILLVLCSVFNIQQSLACFGEGGGMGGATISKTKALWKNYRLREQLPLLT
jgi:hypothetical protein